MKAYIHFDDRWNAGGPDAPPALHSDGKKDWASFKHFCFADKPITHMVDLCRNLYWAARAGESHQQYTGPMLGYHPDVPARNEHASVTATHGAVAATGSSPSAAHETRCTCVPTMVTTAATTSSKQELLPAGKS